MNILNTVNMSEITIYLLLISLLAGFWLWELWLSRKNYFGNARLMQRSQTIV